MSKLIRYLMLLPFLFISRVSIADSSIVVEENDLKAAFSIKFLKYAEIHNLGDGINVCVHGDGDIFNSFNKFNAHAQSGVSIRIKPFLINDAAGCNLLYISSTMADSEEILKGLTLLTNILTVSDIGGFAQSYGVVELKRREHSLAFRINLKQAKEANIFIRSELLKLADEIIE